MTPRNTHAMAAAVVLTVLGAHLAGAQQKVEEAGVDSMVADHQVFELEKGHQVILVHEKGIETTTDPSMPTNMTVIDCIGMVDVLPDKTFKGSGLLHPDGPRRRQALPDLEQQLGHAGEPVCELWRNRQIRGRQRRGNRQEHGARCGPAGSERHPVEGIVGVPEPGQVVVTGSRPGAPRV